MQGGLPLLFLEARVTQCEPRWFRPERACWSMLWLSHQTLITLLCSPACWASCAGVRERGRRVAGSQEPRACVSNLESQTSWRGCVRVCVFVGGWGWCAFCKDRKRLPLPALYNHVLIIWFYDTLCKQLHTWNVPVGSFDDKLQFEVYSSF